MVTVELSPAYVWDCDKCGRENFQRAVSVFLDSRNEKDRDIIRAMWDLASADDVPLDERFRVSTRPDQVTCKHCGTDFLAWDAGSREVGPDDEEDDGEEG